MANKKTRYVFIFHDGSLSISDRPLTIGQANEMYDDNMDYDVCAYFPVDQARKMANGIIKLIGGPKVERREK